MEALLAALEQSALASFLRTARWEYAAVSALHILGIALLVGAILPLDLRLLGVWKGIARRTLARVLVPVAACGLLLALVTGAILFSVRAQEYAALTILWVKLSIVALGATAAVTAHLRYGLWLDRRMDEALAGVGAFSLFAWLSALVCGRLIAFF